MKKPRLYPVLLFFLLLSVTILRLLYSGSLTLDPDEAYYWEWSRHLALSYYDHPPLVAYLIFLFTRLGENSALFVRMGAVTLALGATLLLYFLAKDMFREEKIAFLSALLFIIIPIFSVGAVVITPDTPVSFFWILSLYFLYKVASREKSGWWYLLGISLGLGLLSKYTMILFVPSLFLFLILSGRNRKWLFRKELYLALFIALLLFSPVIFWNSQHAWISFRYQLAHGVSSKVRISTFTFLQFLGAQFLLISPLLWIASITGMVISGYIGIKEKKDNFLLLFSLAIITILFFNILSFQDKMQGNWPITGYITTLISVSALFQRFSLSLRRRGKKLLKGFFLLALVFSFLLTLFIHLQALFSLVPIPVNMDTTNALYGWKELGKEVSRMREETPGRVKPFIMANSHQVAGELAFYTDKQYETYQEKGKGLPKQYNYWSDFNSLIGRDAIYVEEGNGQIGKNVRDAFRSIVKKDSLKIYRRGKQIKTFSLYRCRDFRGWQ